MRSGVAIAALTAALAAAAASSAGTPPSGERREVARVRMVLLAASVTTARGRPVRGLGPQDFRLFDGGRPQTIEVVETESAAPVSLAVLLDLSGSMRLGAKLGHAKRAAREVVRGLAAGDRAGLIGFADEQVTWITDLTEDRERFLRRLEVQEALGRSAIYDALAAAPGLVDEQTRRRRAIVLLTDGLDNASHLDTFTAMTRARRVRVPIYTLLFLPTRRELLARGQRDRLRLLARFSEETGGVLFPVHRPEALDRAVARIATEIKHQYVIGYYPDHADWNGSFRQVRLEAVRERLRVRTRRGYYAGEWGAPWPAGEAAPPGSGD